MSHDLSPLFNPKGVVIAGASTHPGKFGFVSLHNLLANGYEGNVYATNLEAENVLGVQTVGSLDEIPDGAADLVFVCTPGKVVPGLLRQAAAKGIKAAFITSAGFKEAGDDGAQAERELVALAEELGMVIAGPNGQGVISTPVNMCAQIVAPYPPAGSIGVVSQSGNLVSTFLNLSRASGVGVSRAISAGNAAMLDVSDYLEWFGTDDATSVALAYVEGLTDGRAFMDRVTSVAAQMPIVLVKGGASDEGSKAAASHTGSLATNDRVFDGAIRQAGAVRADGLEEAFDTAATFATQPLPKGPRVAVVTTVGGWGVLAADAISGSRLELADLPQDLFDDIAKLVPPRWSRNNPIDIAGGETRDTVPDILTIVASHPAIDAVLFLGIGIQSNQARLQREGGFYPDYGLERIVAYHERQDTRYAEAAAEASETSGKPVLIATEFAVADPNNPGPETVRATGKYCYPSASRAVAALAHTWDYAQRRQRRSN
jgi:acetyltransferase